MLYMPSMFVLVLEWFPLTATAHSQARQDMKFCIYSGMGLMLW